MYSSPAGSRLATPRGTSSSADNPTTGTGTQIRLMQVKVLYTFDDNNKSNCLARCAQPLKIQTAYLEPSTEIGIIELRTCVQAIVAASPELIAKLGQDYTVYAYDYSEYETPLVGQGMLSWVLASASATPMAPAQQSRTMVTGRVCKNLLGLFADGIKETLEVKLRLVPVPTCLQSEYLASMEKYRDASTLASEAIDADAWTTFLRANPGFGIGGLGAHDQPQIASYSPTTQLLPTNMVEPCTIGANTNFGQGAFLEPQAQMMQPVSSLTNSFHAYNVVPPTGNSRPATPSGQPQGMRGASSRPSSRASNREGPVSRPRGAARAASFQGPELSAAEDGASRKRARTMKTDWNGPSAFGTNNESLRVTASVAASIRGHELPKSHPTASEIAAGDFGNRPPTPRPGPIQRRPQIGRQRTSLSYEAVAPSSEPYVSPYPVRSYGSFLTSPEGPSGSAGSTPQDMPSSPPVPRNRSPEPSSPALPSYSDLHDSGFMSGPPDVFSGDEDDELRRVEDDKLRIASSHKNGAPAIHSELSITEEVPGDPSLLPRTILPRRAPAKRRPSTNPTRKRRPAGPDVSSPKLSCLPIPQSTNDAQLDQDITDKLDMDRTESNEEQTNNSAGSTGPIARRLERSDSCMSDSLLLPDSSTGGAENKPGNTRRNAGSSMKRKRAIQERLASSIAAGQMPPFCRNCGEISTPTWRKAFVKIEEGSPPDSLQMSDNDEGIITVESVTKEDDGTVTSYRVIKKMISAEEKDFDEVQLCNPCGIWLFKWKIMRPSEQWTKVTNTEVSKPRKRPSKKAPNSALSEAQSEADPLQTVPSSDQPDTASALTSMDDKRQPQDPPPEAPNRTPTMPFDNPCSEARVLEKNAAAAALQKAFQSSPPRFPGSKHSPIDLEAELSPRPTRRLIFPSPRHPGESKVLDNPTVECNFNPANIPLNKSSSNNFVQEDKENLPPTADDEEEEHLDHLFEGSEPPKSPRTPKSGGETEITFKTPSGSFKKQPLATNQYLSPTAGAAQYQSTPNRGSITGAITEQMTPFTAQLTQLISEANYSDIAGAMNDGFGGGSGGHENLFGFPDFGEPDLGAFSPSRAQSSPTLFSLYEDPADRGDPSWTEGFLGNEIEDMADHCEEQ